MRTKEKILLLFQSLDTKGKIALKLYDSLCTISGEINEKELEDLLEKIDLIIKAPLDKVPQELEYFHGILFLAELNLQKTFKRE
jgi:hypothetical protein